MPKISKVRSVSTRPKQAAPPEEERKEFYCSRCKKKYTRQKANFPSSQSTLYKGNGGYLTICNNCLDELYEHYQTVLGSEEAALRRICLKFDYYWNPEVFDLTGNTRTANSRVKSYISKTNLYRWNGKTFDDTLDEEYAKKMEEDAAERPEIVKVVEPVYDSENEEIVVDESVIQYWGTGFTPEMYVELENRRNYWLSQYPDGTILNPGEEGILRQICNLEININQDRAAGKPIEKSVNALNALFGSMNLKPSQKRELEDNGVPFGVEIARFEDDEPIPEPDEEFKDVDNLRHNIITWFLGSLCKTAGIKNDYSKLFEDEVSKYTVERPKYEGDDEGGDT